jgi:hypothetical protein
MPRECYFPLCEKTIRQKSPCMCLFVNGCVCFEDAVFPQGRYGSMCRWMSLGLVGEEKG